MTGELTSLKTNMVLKVCVQVLVKIPDLLKRKSIQSKARTKRLKILKV